MAEEQVAVCGGRRAVGILLFLFLCVLSYVENKHVLFGGRHSPRLSAWQPEKLQFARSFSVSPKT